MSAAFIQSKPAAGSSTSPSAVYTTPPTQGNLLVACVYSITNTAITMSSAGWTAGTSSSGGTGASSYAIRMFWKIAGASETSTVTAVAGSSGWVIGIVEYSGIDTVTPKNIDNAALGTTGVTVVTPSVTPSANSNGIMVVCWGGVRTSTSYSGETIQSSSTGVNERIDQAQTSATGVVYDNFYSSFSGAFAGSATAAASAANAGAITIFNQAAAGAGPTVKRLSALGVG